MFNLDCKKPALSSMPFGHRRSCASHNLLYSLLCLTGTRSRLTPYTSNCEIPSRIPKLTKFAKESCPPRLPLSLPGEDYKQAFFGRKMKQQGFFLSYPTFFLFSFSKKKECWCGVRSGISPEKFIKYH